MIKARIWILDDKDPEKDEVYENFDMLRQRNGRRVLFSIRLKIINLHLSLLS